MIQSTSRIRIPFTKEEDQLLIKLVNKYGDSNWALISSMMPHSRTSRQCRERWMNWINIGFVKECWSPAEDSLLIQKVDELGSHWKLLEKFFPGRISYTLRNRYKKLQQNSLKQNCCKLSKTEKQNQSTAEDSLNNDDCSNEFAADTFDANISEPVYEDHSISQCNEQCTSCKSTTNLKTCEQTTDCKQCDGTQDTPQSEFDQLSPDYYNDNIEFCKDSWCRCVSMKNIAPL